MTVVVADWSVATEHLRSDRVLAQLVRFALVGGAANVVYFAIFVALRPEGVLLANLAAAAASTVLANELHRRVTFGAADRINWLAAQWESAGLAIAGLAASSAALAALDFAFPGASSSVAALYAIVVSAAVGGVRFLLLRGIVFA